MVAPIEVRVNLSGLPEAQRAMREMPNRLAAWMKTGATKGARRTLPTVKGNIGPHNRTGQLKKSQGVKYKGFRDGWTVMLGARRYFRAMDQNRGVVDPAKYSHLTEGGRKTVRLGVKTNKRGVKGPSNTTAAAMPIFVKRVDPNLRRKADSRKFGASQLQTFGKPGKADRFRKVPGGYIVFAMSAKLARPVRQLKKSESEYGRNIESEVKTEIRSNLP